MNFLAALLASFVAVAVANPVHNAVARETVLEARAVSLSSTIIWHAALLKKLLATAIDGLALGMGSTQSLQTPPALRSAPA
ncbi:hypothetical protein DFH06DRAFT_1330754 [Mycena polygramma]|nr:hypothetical protein DFH06DRAFT_1330754 [Mycena polygramma]